MPKMKLPRKMDVAPTLFLVAVSIVLGLPMLLHGSSIDGHDTTEHLNFMKHFSEQFWSGDSYPRWLTNMNTGLGSPSYFVFPPFPAYVYAMLDPVARVFHFNALNVAAWLPLLCSGITALLWLQTFVSRTIATLCAALYMLMPYHLTIDFYRRCAISECWALVWMPLLLYFTIGVIAGKRRDLIGLAISFALMILSHLISVAMFFWIPIVLAMLLSRPGKRIRSGIRLMFAMALGTCISAVYLLPALANAKYFPASRLMRDAGYYQLEDKLVFFGSGLLLHSMHVTFLQAVSWTVVTMVVAVAICTPVTLKWATHDSKIVVLFWITVCGFSVFMTLRLSWQLWDHIHPLHDAIQFPWRFNGLLCIGALALIAIFLANVSREVQPLRIAYTGSLILVVIIWLCASCNVYLRNNADVPSGPRYTEPSISDNDGWLLAWIAPGTQQRASLVASSGPKVRFREGGGSTQLLLWKPRKIELQTQSSTGGWIMINQLYFSTWEAELIDQGKRAMIRPAMPEGLIEVQAPPGNQHIEIDIPISRMEYMGGWLSVLSLLYCLIFCFSKKVGGSHVGKTDIECLAH